MVQASKGIHCMGDIKGGTERRELTPCIIYADMSCHHSPHHTQERERERGNLGFESVETGKKGWTDRGASEGLELAKELSTQLTKHCTQVHISKHD